MPILLGKYQALILRADTLLSPKGKGSSGHLTWQRQKRGPPFTGSPNCYQIRGETRKVPIWMERTERRSSFLSLVISLLFYIVFHHHCIRCLTWRNIKAIFTLELAFQKKFLKKRFLFSSCHTYFNDPPQEEWNQLQCRKVLIWQFRNKFAITLLFQLSGVTHFFTFMCLSSEISAN